MIIFAPFIYYLFRSFFFLAMIVNKEAPFTDDFVPGFEFVPLIFRRLW